MSANLSTLQTMHRERLELDSPETIFEEDRHLEDEIAELIGTYTGWAGLEDFCRDGGSVHDVEAFITLDPYDNQSAEITGSLEITFEERYHRGCRDMTWSNHYKGQGTLTIDTATGAVSVDISAKLQPSADELAAQAEWEEKQADMAPDDEPQGAPPPF